HSHRQPVSASFNFAGGHICSTAIQIDSSPTVACPSTFSNAVSPCISVSCNSGSPSLVAYRPNMYSVASLFSVCPASVPTNCGYHSEAHMTLTITETLSASSQLPAVADVDNANSGQQQQQPQQQSPSLSNPENPTSSPAFGSLATTTTAAASLSNTNIITTTTSFDPELSTAPSLPSPTAPTTSSPPFANAVGDSNNASPPLSQGALAGFLGVGAVVLIAAATAAVFLFQKRRERVQRQRTISRLSALLAAPAPNTASSAV
ncbi:hypothetical protein BDR26DRAFT_853891, partial [Obelidium mucronatum]